jgi:small GTP-binding protein
MQIWDTAGQERFKNITQTYYKGAAGILLVYSIADAVSLANIEKWMAQIDSTVSGDVCKVLVGTKCDLADERVVASETGEQLAAKFGMQFLEVSAKTGERIKDAFEMLGTEIDEKRTKNGGAGLEDVSGRKVVRVGEHAEKNCAC